MYVARRKLFPKVCTLFILYYVKKSSIKQNNRTKRNLKPENNEASIDLNKGLLSLIDRLNRGSKSIKNPERYKLFILGCVQFS